MKPDLDVIPARVRLPDGMRDRTRVVVAAGRAVVWEEGPSLVASGDVVDFEVGSRRAPTLVHLTDGTTWEVTRGSGCGCGSKLRRMSVEELVT